MNGDQAADGGPVADFDMTCQADEMWYYRNQSQPPRNQPWYHVLVHGSGATTYAAKLLFGGHIEQRWLYFRFTNGIVNRLTRPIHHLFDFESNDPELTRLRAGKA